VPTGAALALLAALTGAIVAACYDIPRPACGFFCGPDGECPEGYICASDRACHRIGSPDNLMCRSPDAMLPIDAAPEVPDSAIDATVKPALEAVPGAPEATGALLDDPTR
jgi:hypothetical protein